MPRSRFTVSLAAALALPFSASFVHAQASAEAAPQGSLPSLTVTTDPVRLETVPEVISGTGLVTAWQEATIGASAGGLVLTEIGVGEGDRVEKAQVLARLDGALLRAQIAEEQAAIASAQATYEIAVSSSERGRRLARTGDLSSQLIEERETTVKTAAAALGQATAALKTLEVQLDRTVIRAPFAGIVSAKPATVGSIVQASTEILRIQRDGALRVSLDLPEQYLPKIAVGDACKVTGSGGSEIPGKVALIGETVDPRTHLGTVEIELPAGSKLKAGMFVRAAIASGGADAMTVAESALKIGRAHV